MKNVGLLVILIVVTFGYTQEPDTLWTRTYGGIVDDEGRSIHQTSDGGYIIVGQYANLYLWLLKTDAQGDTLWTKIYGAHYNYGVAVQQTTDGGYFIAGQRTQFVDDWQIWLLKTDAQGDTLWTKIHGDTLLKEVCAAAQQTTDGGYIIAGYYVGALHDYPFLLKTDANGDTVWTNHFGVATKRCFSVDETWDGGYIVAGSHWAYQPFYDHFPWCAKTDANGNTMWSKTYVAPGVFYSVKQTADSEYVACGFVDTWPQGRIEVYLAKTDQQGDSVWARHYGDTATGVFGTSLELTNDNCYIIVAREGWEPYWCDNIYLYKTDETGDSLWCAVYGESESSCEIGYAALQTNDGSYVVVGCTDSHSAGGFDVWIVKTEPDVGVDERPSVKPVEKQEPLHTTIFKGPLQLPKGKKCKLFDITGRAVELTKIQPGIYFIEIDGVVTQKVVKVR